MECRHVQGLTHQFNSQHHSLPVLDALPASTHQVYMPHTCRQYTRQRIFVCFCFEPGFLCIDQADLRSQRSSCLLSAGMNTTACKRKFFRVSQRQLSYMYMKCFMHSHHCHPACFSCLFLSVPFPNLCCAFTAFLRVWPPGLTEDCKCWHLTSGHTVDVVCPSPLSLPLLQELMGLDCLVPLFVGVSLLEGGLWTSFAV